VIECVVPEVWAPVAEAVDEEEPVAEADDEDDDEDDETVTPASLQYEVQAEVAASRLSPHLSLM